MTEKNDPYLIITADSHAGLPTAMYKDYLESKFHPQFDDFMTERAAELQAITDLGLRDEKFSKKWFEEHADALKGGYEAPRRDLELDHEGAAAEVIFPDADAVDSQTCVPFGAGLGMSGDLDPALGLAGAAAHNRWLAELCQFSPERRCGVALVPITADLDKVLAEIRRAKDMGLGAIMIPAMWMGQEPYHHERYEPVWALCEDLELPVTTHSGPAARDEYGDHLGIYVSEVTWWPARPLWFLLWSGVFERHPGLKFGVAEAGCWWLPNLLWTWDRLVGSGRVEKLSSAFPLSMLPTEYVDRQVFVAATSCKRRELAMRYEMGVGNICWGNDFPHPEGTWPRSREWLKGMFGDIPIDETRQMLGINAAEVYGFDLDKLRVHADRVGPTPTDIGQLHEGEMDDTRLEDLWRTARETGRHWLTGVDLPHFDHS